MKFTDGILIGGASGIGATLVLGALTELIVISGLVAIAVGRYKWKKRQNTLSTTKKSQSSYP